MVTDVRYIYAIIDPKTFEAVWVGASFNPQRRLREHYSALYGREMEKRGYKPRLLILEEATVETWRDVERWWIAYLRRAGAPLYNQADGGGGDVANSTVRQRISTTLSGRTMSEESRTAISMAKRGKPKSAEHRAKQSAAMKGRRPADITLQRAREVTLGTHPSAETLAKLSAIRRGKKQNPEWVAKRVAAIAATKLRKALKAATSE